MKRPNNLVFITLGFIATTASLTFANSANAVAIKPISYDMPNGTTGSYNYWDKNYTGNGNTTGDFAPLSGGLGDLTDGIIPTGNWSVEEPPRGGNGPYVGWRNIDPTIKFNFGGSTNIDSVTIYVDDSNGSGGVSVPGSVDLSMGGSVASINLTDPPGSAPTSYTFSNLGFSGSSLDLTLNRKHYGSWIFLSEVTFEGSQQTTAVPTPALLPGLIGMGITAVRKKKQKELA